MRRAQVWIPLALVAATLGAYQGVRTHGFVDVDDLPYVVHNPDLDVASPLEGIRVAFQSTSQVNWTPLTVLSLQLDRSLYGQWAPGYALTSVLLHAASAAGVEVEDGLWEQVLTHFLDSQEKEGKAFSLKEVEFGRNAAMIYLKKCVI